MGLIGINQPTEEMGHNLFHSSHIVKHYDWLQILVILNVNSINTFSPNIFSQILGLESIHRGIITGLKGNPQDLKPPHWSKTRAPHCCFIDRVTTEKAERGSEQIEAKVPLQWPLLRPLKGQVGKEPMAQEPSHLTGTFLG